MERKRILIAVKLPDQIQALRNALVSAGYEVKSVDNGAAALTLCREFRPHLLLAEISLPKIDGHHLLRELKAQSATKNIAFVLLSPHRSVEERVHSINLGLDDYITIPFDVNEVLIRFEIILKEVEHFETVSYRNTNGFSGRLSEMNVMELLQTLEIGKKTGVAKIQNHEKEGIIYIKKGEVIDAVLDNLDAPNAVFRMFTWLDGTFQFELTEVEQPRVLNVPVVEILQKGLLFRDRWETLVKSLPPLQASVKVSPNVSKTPVTDQEKTLLSLINGRTRLIDLIEKSKLNDLMALQILVNLFSRGALVEQATEEIIENSTARSNGSGDSANSQQQLAVTVSKFLKSENGTLTNGTAERRQNERRRSERRFRHRRRTDSTDEGTRIHLNKSELLMIRQKLAQSAEDQDTSDILF